MKSERIILSLITLLIGLLAAGVGFYIYQMTTTKPGDIKKVTINNVISPSPEIKEVSILAIDSPLDESVSDKRTIILSGKSKPHSTIVISSATSDAVATADSNGSFSSPFSLDEGVNSINILTIHPDGKEEHSTRTVTYTTESF